MSIELELTRGERNRNPGNLDRNNIMWEGMSAEQSDQRFVTFSDVTYGIRALARTLLSYYRKHGLHTVRGIIDRWAPPTENDTGAYVNHVADELGVTPDETINVENPLVLEKLTIAIIKHENGRCIYDDPTIVAAIDKALA